MAHPFIFNSFMIKSDEQIRTLKELGVKQVLYIPEKSDCRPVDLKPEVFAHLDPRMRVNYYPFS